MKGEKEWEITSVNSSIWVDDRVYTMTVHSTLCFKHDSCMCDDEIHSKANEIDLAKTSYRKLPEKEELA